MSSWEGKTRGGLTGYQIFLFLLKNVNLRAAYLLLYFVALYYVLFASKARKPMYYYFNKRLNFGHLKTFYYLYLNNITFGKVIIDKVVMMAGFPNKFTFDFDGENHLHSMAESGGGLIIGSHVGNWEIAGQLLTRIKTTVHIVMLDAEHQKIKKLIQSVSNAKKMNVIPIKEDLSHLFKIKDALLANEIVAIHGDRFLPGSKTMEVNFLGAHAHFPTGPFYIAMKYNKPVTFVSAIKENNTHYHFMATEPKLYANSRCLEDRNKEIYRMIRDYTIQLEKTLFKHPEQWFNYYYFWDKTESQ